MNKMKAAGAKVKSLFGTISNAFARAFKPAPRLSPQPVRARVVPSRRR